MLFQLKRIKRSITTTQRRGSVCTNKVFDPQLQAFTKKRQRFHSFSSKVDSKQDKLNFSQLVKILSLALDHYYATDSSCFLVQCKQLLSTTQGNQKMKIIQRLNTYQYIQQAIRHKPFCDIQAEVMKQWRRNSLFSSVLISWSLSMLRANFTTMKEFISEYQMFRQFIAQTSYMIFKGWFRNLEKKGVAVLDKICDQTAHFIITEATQFRKVYERIIRPLAEVETRGKQINWKLDLVKMNIKKCIYDQRRQHNLPKTIEVLKKFSRQLKIAKKIQLLRLYRQTLDSQLIQNQRQLIKNKELKGLQILQKDDFITALVYCIVAGEIKEIQTSMIYLKSVLGQNLWLLSKMQVDPYAIDILAASQFLTQKDLPEQISHQYTNNHLRITISSPSRDTTFVEESPVLIAKHITSLERY